jgi:hypothetical protein
VLVTLNLAISLVSSPPFNPVNFSTTLIEISLVIIASSSISWYLNPESVTSVVSTTLPVLLLYIFPIATPSLYN